MINKEWLQENKMTQDTTAKLNLMQIYTNKIIYRGYRVQYLKLIVQSQEGKSLSLKYQMLP